MSNTVKFPRLSKFDGKCVSLLFLCLLESDKSEVDRALLPAGGSVLLADMPAAVSTLKSHWLAAIEFGN